MVQMLEKDAVVYAVKAFADVALDNPMVTSLKCEIVYTLQRHGRIPHRAKSVGVVEELSF